MEEQWYVCKMTRYYDGGGDIDVDIVASANDAFNKIRADLDYDEWANKNDETMEWNDRVKVFLLDDNVLFHYECCKNDRLYFWMGEKTRDLDITDIYKKHLFIERYSENLKSIREINVS